MCDECIWHLKTFLVQWFRHLAISCIIRYLTADKIRSFGLSDCRHYADSLSDCWQHHADSLSHCREYVVSLSDCRHTIWLQTTSFDALKTTSGWFSDCVQHHTYIHCLAANNIMIIHCLTADSIMLTHCRQQYADSLSDCRQKYAYSLTADYNMLIHCLTADNNSMLIHCLTGTRWFSCRTFPFCAASSVFHSSFPFVTGANGIKSLESDTRCGNYGAFG